MATREGTFTTFLDSNLSDTHTVVLTLLGLLQLPKRANS